MKKKNVSVIVQHGVGNQIYILMTMVRLLIEDFNVSYYHKQTKNHEYEHKHMLKHLFPILMTRFTKLRYSDSFNNKKIIRDVNLPIDLDKINNKIIDNFLLNYKYWAGTNDEYFNDVLKIMRFSYNKELKEHIKHKFDINNDLNYVCVHVRHGDYTLEKYKNKFIILPPEYYINLLKDEERPIVFITDTGHDFIKTKIIPYLNSKNIAISSNSFQIDFTLGIMARRLVSSPSTMSYTMAYLNINEANIELDVYYKYWKNPNPKYKLEDFLKISYFKHINIIKTEYEYE